MMTRGAPEIPHLIFMYVEPSQLLVLQRKHPLAIGLSHERREHLVSLDIAKPSYLNGDQHTRRASSTRYSRAPDGSLVWR